MPSSFVDSVPPIVKTLVEINPHRLLDVGPGWGKYGLMAREYLPELELLWALEVVEGRKSTQDAIYDRVLLGDIRAYCDPAQTSPFSLFDLVLLIDVIEHISLDEGHDVLRVIQSAGCPVLVSTPKVFVEQHDDANPHETHRSVWNWLEFRQHGIVLDASTTDSVIYLLEAR